MAESIQIIGAVLGLGEISRLMLRDGLLMAE